MPYSQIDLLINNLDALVNAGEPDDFLKSFFAALVAVEAAATFEKRIKEILIDYCRQQNTQFGLFAEKIFGRLKGRIQIKDLKDNYLAKLGGPLVDKFAGELENIRNQAHGHNYPDPADFYNNLIQARHKFVHENVLQLSFDEAKNYYLKGIEIISALERTINGP